MSSTQRFTDCKWNVALDLSQLSLPKEVQKGYLTYPRSHNKLMRKPKMQTQIFHGLMITPYQGPLWFPSQQKWRWELERACWHQPKTLEIFQATPSSMCLTSFRPEIGNPQSREGRGQQDPGKLSTSPPKKHQENIKGCSCFEKTVWQFPQKVRYRITTGPRNSTLRYILKKTENTCSH